MSVLTIDPNPSSVGDTVAIATVADLPVVEYGAGGLSYDTPDWALVVGSPIAVKTATSIDIDNVGYTVYQADAVPDNSVVRVTQTVYTNVAGTGYASVVHNNDESSQLYVSSSPSFSGYALRIQNTTPVNINLLGTGGLHQDGDEVRVVARFASDTADVDVEVYRSGLLVAWLYNEIVSFPLNGVNLSCFAYLGRVNATLHSIIKTSLNYSLEQDAVEITSGVSTDGIISYDHTAQLSDNNTDWKYIVDSVDSNIVTMLVNSLTITPNPSNIGDTVAVATTITDALRFDNGAWSTLYNSQTYNPYTIVTIDPGATATIGRVTGYTIQTGDSVRIVSEYVSGAFHAVYPCYDTALGESSIPFSADESTVPYRVVAVEKGAITSITEFTPFVYREAGDVLDAVLTFEAGQIIVDVVVFRANGDIVVDEINIIPFADSSRATMTPAVGSFNGSISVPKYGFGSNMYGYNSYSLTQEAVEIDSGTTIGGAISYDHTAQASDNNTDWKYIVDGVDSNIVTMLVNLTTITPNPSNVGDTVAVATVANDPNIEYGTGFTSFNVVDWEVISGTVVKTDDYIQCATNTGTGLALADTVRDGDVVETKETFVSGTNFYSLQVSRDASFTKSIFIQNVAGIYALRVRNDGVGDVSETILTRVVQVGDYSILNTTFSSNSVSVEYKIYDLNENLLVSGTRIAPFANNGARLCQFGTSGVMRQTVAKITRSVDWSLTQDAVEIDSGVTTGGAISYDHTAQASDNNTDWKYIVDGVDSNIVTMLVDASQKTEGVVTWGTGGNYATATALMADYVGATLTGATMFLQVGDSDDTANTADLFLFNDTTGINTAGFPVILKGDSDYTVNHFHSGSQNFLKIAATAQTPDITLDGLNVLTRKLLDTSSNCLLTIKNCIVDHQPIIATPGTALNMSSNCGLNLYSSHIATTSEFQVINMPNDDAYIEDCIFDAHSATKLFNLSVDDIYAERIYVNGSTGLEIDPDYSIVSFDTVFCSMDSAEVAEGHDEIDFNTDNFVSVTPGDTDYGVPRVDSVLSFESDFETNIGHKTDIYGRRIERPSAGCYSALIDSVGGVELTDGPSIGNISSFASILLADSYAVGTVPNNLTIADVPQVVFGTVWTLNDQLTLIDSVGFGTEVNFDTQLSAFDPVGFGNEPGRGSALTDPIEFFGHEPELGVKISASDIYGYTSLKVTFSADIELV